MLPIEFNVVDAAIGIFFENCFDHSACAIHQLYKRVAAVGFETDFTVALEWIGVGFYFHEPFS